MNKRKSTSRMALAALGMLWVAGFASLQAAETAAAERVPPAAVPLTDQEPEESPA